MGYRYTVHEGTQDDALTLSFSGPVIGTYVHNMRNQRVGPAIGEEIEISGASGLWRVLIWQANETPEETGTGELIVERVPDFRRQDGGRVS
jgi:hypothetical protein